MSGADPYYITTAISYPNGPPHIGHAYEVIATDVIARFMRLDGRDVRFQTGTDEHGLKMKQTADAEGLEVKALADRNAARFEAMATTLNTTHDVFIRTTEERHYRACQALWEALSANGDIYLDTYAGWYSVRDEAFYGEDETEVGDDGVRRGPQGTPVTWNEEETYFFRLSAYQDKLLAHYEAHPTFIQPDERRNEVVSFVSRGLKDLALSRSTLDWGVPVPDAPGHVMYVWIDALTNYITGVGYPDSESEDYARYWPAAVHIIGKDIVRFHAVYWPAFLMSAGLALPVQVFGHGFMLNRGEKMSKSVGNTIDPLQLVEAFGVDQVRYFLTRDTTFGRDGNYTHEAIVNRINADLANDIGNLAQRSLSMIAKNCAGAVPQPGAFTPADQALLAQTDALHASARAHMDHLAIKAYLDAVWEVVGEANRYFTSEEPWAKRKTDFARMETILYVTAEVVRQVAVMAQPVVPQGAAKLLDALGQDGGDARAFAALGEAGRLKPGTALPKPEGAFPRYVAPEADAAGAGSADKPA
ncbi:MAG: methionine--tRNA ligase [Pseudomonadota bacterium]